MAKINIAVAGGPCTGKSTLAAHLYVHLKIEGFDYDLIQEECRKLKREFGKFNDPFERFYFWRQQEREELRSTAKDGFITDKPLFHYYVQVQQFASAPRDKLALRELYRMCLELRDQDRYHLIVIATNPGEIPYKKDKSRSSTQVIAGQRHSMIIAFIKHMWLDWPTRMIYVDGNLEERTMQVLKAIKHKRRIL